MTAPTNSPTYGWRAKLGVIVPPTNTVNEAEWNLAVPEGVTVHAARMALHTDTTSTAGLDALHRDLAEAVHSLKPAGVAAIAYGCTAGSMIAPRHALAERMSDEVDLPCVTTAAAIVDALEAVGAKRITVATPYDKRLNDHEVEFLTSQELEVLAIEGLGLGANGPAEYPLIHRVPETRIMELARSVDQSEADALVISCTDFPAFGLIEDLESELGKPVITSNQATLWATLRAAGIEDKLSELGQLFRDF
jgi:maleate cis-trans isomerase